MIGTFLIFPISWFCIIFAVAVAVIIVIAVIAVIAIITATVDDANVVIVSLIQQQYRYKIVDSFFFIFI